MRLCLSSTMRCLRSSGASTRRFLVWLRHACSNSSLRPWRDLWAANSSSCLWWGWCRPRWKRRTGGRKENRNTSQNLMRMRRFTKNNFWYCCCEKNRSTNVLIFCLNSLNLIFFFLHGHCPVSFTCLVGNSLTGLNWFCAGVESIWQIMNLTWIHRWTKSILM